jgi:hypothetical protein
MKKMCCIIFCNVLFGLGFSQTNIDIKKNTVLNYIVKTEKGIEYAFNVTVANYSANGIKFNWDMNGANKSNGTVTIYKSAIESAITYKNYFGNKSNEKLTKESTVWLSKKNYKDFIDTKSTSLALDFTIQSYKQKADYTYYTTLNGKKITLTSFTAVSTTTTNNLIILKSETNPLILKMQVKDFSITLKSITQ